MMRTLSNGMHLRGKSIVAARPMAGGKIEIGFRERTQTIQSHDREGDLQILKRELQSAPQNLAQDTVRASRAATRAGRNSAKFVKVLSEGAWESYKERKEQKKAPKEQTEAPAPA